MSIAIQAEANVKLDIAIAIRDSRLSRKAYVKMPSLEVHGATNRILLDYILVYDAATRFSR